MEDIKADKKGIEVFPPIVESEEANLSEIQPTDDNLEVFETNPKITDVESGQESEDEADPQYYDLEGFDIVFEGEAPDPIEEEAKEAPSWVKELRKKHRESERERQKLEKELEQARAKLEPALEPLPDRPKFEDFAYDEDKYEAALSQWHSNKLKHESKKQEEQQKSEAVQQQFEERRQRYHKAKSEIAKKVPDMAEAEELVTTLFDETKQAILLTAADDPAQLIYALGKNPKKLQDLASIDDPIRFTAEAAKLEAKMKVTKRTPKATPERKVQGSASATSSESQLDRLREEAEKSGDYSKVIAYKRERRHRSA